MSGYNPIRVQTNQTDASNWREGRVPGANDDVVLDRGDNVVIDPTLGQAQIENQTRSGITLRS